MHEHHTLGRMKVRAGEILTFTYDESVPDKRCHLTVVAIADIDLSQEMATYCVTINRSTRDIYTENALPGFIEYLAEKRLLHVGTEVNIHFGTTKRPAARLMGEYRFDINPESFWEAKLIHRYQSNSFTVYNHQHHMLTIMSDVEAPFLVLADIIDMKGEYLGVLRLSVLSEDSYTLFSDEDLERIRLALQADISLNVVEISVLVESVKLVPNPDFTKNAFGRHLPVVTPPISKPTQSTPQKGKIDEPSLTV